jgi:hypothetical protein
MSNEPGSAVYRAAILLDHASAFVGFVSRASDHDLNSKMEIENGRLARLIALLLNNLKPDLTLLSFSTQDKMVSLRRLFFDLIGQWEWDNVIGPNGKEVLAESERKSGEREHRFLSVARALVEGCLREGCVDAQAKHYLGDAERAKREQIPAALISLDEARSKVEPLCREWFHTPYLAPSFPTCTQDEFLEFEQIVFRCGRVFQEESWHELQSEQSAVTTHTSTPSRTPTENTREAKGITDHLTPNDWKLLRAMKRLGAIDSEHAASREKITKNAGTGNLDSKHNRETFDRLKRMGLIDAARRVGSWLTTKALSLLASENR